MSPTREHFEAPAPVGSAKGGAKYPFSMDVDFHDELTPTQRQAFREAVVDRWLKVIVGGGPPVLAGGETVAGLLVLAKCENLPDKKGGLSANTDLDVAALRGTAAGPTAHLPGKATITLDSIDMAVLDAEEAAAVGSAKTDIGRYRVDLIAHEIGHAQDSPRLSGEERATPEEFPRGAPVFTWARRPRRRTEPRSAPGQRLSRWRSLETTRSSLATGDRRSFTRSS
jgi:hypothetical protein